MKFIFYLLLLAGLPVMAQHGKVIEEQIVKSPIRNKDVKYTIYLPADYETSQRTYPVVYLLHGYTDDNTGWLQFGEINRLADKAIAEGTIPPMIIVMPNGDSTFYINSFDGKDKFEDFFVKEFIPTIEKTYRIKSQKQFRGIAGLSMGGYGTLIYSLKYPELFAAAAPLSGAVFVDEDVVKFPQENWKHPFAQLYGPNLAGKAWLTKHYNDNSILKLVETIPAEKLKSVKYWIDCGDDDFLIKGNCYLHIALKDKEIPHEFRIRDGVHNWDYWRSGIIDALAFIGKSFHQ
ncbi:MAG: esterase family protein [Chitinophagaceae bacterium]|nr:MAG: esterase family protein [Chitinophagaceae bacterium]